LAPVNRAFPPSLQAPFRALAIAIVPDAATLDEKTWREMDASIAEALAKRPPSVRRQLALLIRILDALPLLRWGRRFHQLGAARKARFLDALQYSPILLLRRGVWGLRTLVFLAYYTRPEVQTTLGYRAAPRGWSARR
jgi:hypothetical protein